MRISHRVLDRIGVLSLADQGKIPKYRRDSMNTNTDTMTLEGAIALAECASGQDDVNALTDAYEALKAEVEKRRRHHKPVLTLRQMREDVAARLEELAIEGHR